jgi:hypothetical protein
MKKYSWLVLLAFALALVTCLVIVSKNESVRETFMKAAEDMPYFMEQARVFAEKTFRSWI